jgi:AcrR family transcriptional regulator
MSTQARTPLSRDRVLRAAVDLADEHGIEALTMRRLAEAVGAEAMSLYYHVANKDEVLDGVVDTIADEVNQAVARVEGSPAGPGWRDVVRRRILAAREVFLRHPWAPAVFVGHSDTSQALLVYFDGLVGIMRAGGFSHDTIHHALHALGSRAIGFSQELVDMNDPPAGAPDLAAMAARLPNLVNLLAEVAHDDPGSTLGWCDHQTEFEFGLDIVLDGLERLR